MNIELSSGQFGGTLHAKVSESPLFKEEVMDKAKAQKTPEYQIETLKTLFEKVAESLDNSHLKKGWGQTKETRQLRSSFYKAVSDLTKIDVKEIQQKIDDYVKQNPQKILNMAKEISKKTGWNLENIKQNELIDLVKQTSKNIFTSLTGQEPMMKSRHIANFIIAQACAEIFDINITLHDVMIIYDQDINAGSVQEQLRFKATVSKDAPQLNLMQGFASINSGFFSSNPKIGMYHIEPQVLVK